MPPVKIFLPDHSFKEFDHKPSILEVAQSLGSRLAQVALGGTFNDSPEIHDVRDLVPQGTHLRILTNKDERSLEVVRHSAAHAMAQAVQELWPQVQVTLGPVIEQGFFYDFYADFNFSPENFETIEKKMQEIIARNDEVIREVWDKDRAIEVFEKMGESFKVEIIKDLNQPQVSIYRQGKWFDLCRGPHVQRTGQISVVKVLSLAGAYWRGDETKARLQRIYATAFHKKKQLQDYLQLQEEEKKRDHRKLGKQLKLFYFNPLCPGMPFFTSRGAIIYNELQNFIREKYIKHGYEEVITPQVYDVELYHKSGHYENYRENMYFCSIDEKKYSFKPMNCPSHCLLYQAEKKSYRNLPWRIADFGRLHRYERSGVMHGLTRVRSFAQDDAHIFCTLEDLQTEIEDFVTFLKEVYEVLGMPEYKLYLSIRPEKKMGSEQNWDQAEQALEKGLKALGLSYKVNPGEGAFYGPKLDVMFVDALKRSWQLGTLQCDFNMPQAFGLKYVGRDNLTHTPVLFHRAVLGSLERFIGVYLEHRSGHLPLWLSPVQVKVLTVGEAQKEEAQNLVENLLQLGFRVELDDRGEKLGFKIREAQTQKIPYAVVIGFKEQAENKVSVRLSGGKMKNLISKDFFINQLLAEWKERKPESEWL